MSITQLVTSGPLLLALPVAAAAGAVTFLSPCCLPLVPGYLSFVTGMAGAGGPSSPAEPASVPPAAGAPASGAPAAVAPAAGVAVAAPPLAATAAVPPRGRVVAGTALFVLGFSVVFVAYGAALGGLGHLLTGHARVLTQVLGGVTILLVEQNARMALGVCDQVLVLGKGAVVFAGATAEFRRREAELKGRYLSV